MVESFLKNTKTNDTITQGIETCVIITKKESSQINDRITHKKKE